LALVELFKIARAISFLKDSTPTRDKVDVREGRERETERERQKRDHHISSEIGSSQVNPPLGQLMSDSKGRRKFQPVLRKMA